MTRRSGSFCRSRGILTPRSHARRERALVGTLHLSWRTLIALSDVVALALVDGPRGEGVETERRALERLTRRIAHRLLAVTPTEDAFVPLEVSRAELRFLDEALEHDASCAALVSEVERVVLSEARRSGEDEP